jgi:hypothetical protein
MAGLRNNLGTELIALGRAEQAAGEFQAALALREGADFRNFGRVLSLFGLGDAKMLLGEREEAYEYWRQAYQSGFFSGDLGRLLTDFAGRVVAHGIDMSGRGVAVMGDPGQHRQMLRDRALPRDPERQSGQGRAVRLSWLATSWRRRRTWRRGIALCRDMLTRYADVDERSTVLQSLRMNYASLLLRQGTVHCRKLSICCGTATRWSTARWRSPARRAAGEFAGKWIGVIEMLISLLLDHGETLAIPGGADPRLLAFGIHEAAKARGFLAALAGVDVAAPAEVDPGLRHREAELIRLRRDLQTEADLTGSGKSFGRIQEVQGQLRHCWQEMQESAPAFVRLRRGIPSDIEDARRVLREHATRPMAIVSFFCAADRRIFLLRSDDPEVGVVRSEWARRARVGGAAAAGTFSTGSSRTRARSAGRTVAQGLGFFEDLGQELLSFCPSCPGGTALLRPPWPGTDCPCTPCLTVTAAT